MNMLQNRNAMSLIAALEPMTQNPDELGRPLRCRAALFDDSESNIILVGRSKPDTKPYAVFPGGGLEPTDETPKAGVLREINEELSIKPEDVTISDRVLVHKDEFFYIGHVKSGVELKLGGPEASRDTSVSGTYTPEWVALTGLKDLRVRPKVVAKTISAAFTELRSDT